MPTYRELQFENEHVSVWKTVISPDHPLPMHRHNNGRVVISLNGGELMRINENGSCNPIAFEAHKAYWLAADQEHEGLHGDLNVNSEPVVVMVIEMKHPQGRPFPPKPID